MKLVLLKFKRDLSSSVGNKSQPRQFLYFRSFHILTCQRRKSLRRTSPEVRMSRSGLGELLLYKHSLSNDSETSLSNTEERKHIYIPFWTVEVDRISVRNPVLPLIVYLALIRPCSTPDAISLTALVISYLDVYAKHTFRKHLQNKYLYARGKL